MKKLAVTVAFLFSNFAMASVLENHLGSNQIEGVTLSQTATVVSNSATTELQMVGAGLRKKKVLMMKVNVYVAQLFLSSPNTFSRTDSTALSSASKSNVAAIQLTFLRDVPADKIQTSFVDAFEANKVSVQQADIKDFLSAVASSGDAKSGKTLTIVLSKDSAGNESLVYEDTVGKVSTVKGQSGLAQNILSIWLGTPADNELGDTKTQILSGK